MSKQLLCVLVFPDISGTSSQLSTLLSSAHTTAAQIDTISATTIVKIPDQRSQGLQMPDVERPMDCMCFRKDWWVASTHIMNLSLGALAPETERAQASLVMSQRYGSWTCPCA
jgi:hypothetical protein